MKKIHKVKGQALVMVTFGLLAIVGLVGLGVDLSWSYFLEKTMQAAADTAAMSAVQAARVAGGAFANVNCGGSISCYATQTSCTSISSGSADVACRYALQNGFARSEVTIVASDDTTAPTVTDTACSAPETVRRPPTTGCVNTLYWVTVRITKQVPQLFSAILGAYEGSVSARGTAAIAESIVEGSLILINRNNDMSAGNLPNSAPPYGTNLDVGGGSTVDVPGGIILASSSAVRNHEAGQVSGSSEVVSPWTRVRAGGTIGGSQPEHWRCVSQGAYCAPTPTGDGPQFNDPMSNRHSSQPPLATTTLPLIPVPGGALSALTNAGQICENGCPPGIYYATAKDRNGGTTEHPSGAQLTINGNISFGQGSPFNEFMFVGGLNVSTNSNVTLGPGRYVYAGVADPRDNVLDIPNGVTFTGGNGSDAGRIMIYTDFREGANREAGGTSAESYAGQMDAVYNQLRTFYTTQASDAGGNSWAWVPWANSGLKHGAVSIQSGNNAQSQVTLYGLKAGDGNIPSDLEPYAPVLMWQDQHNSYVKYTNNAQVDTSCGDINSPCTRTVGSSPGQVDDDGAPEFNIQASPFTTYQGVIYQPRGSWTSFYASGDYIGPIQVVAGSMKVQGTSDLQLTGLTVPLTIYTVSLVE